MLRYFAYSARDFGRSPDRSDFRLNWEFWIAFRGAVRPVFHDHSRSDLPATNFWVMAPNLRFHWETSPAKIERAVVHFAYVPAPLEEITSERGFFCRKLSAPELAEARGIAKAIAAAVARRDRLSPLHFQRALLDLTLLGLRHEPSQSWSTLETHVADRVERAVAWYKKHVHEAPKLGRVAAELHLSVSHLRRLFHAYYHKSPKLVFDRLRLELASSLLASSTSTLDDVAGRTGFKSTTDFCRVFKKHFGHPPNEWRRTKNRARVSPDR